MTLLYDHNMARFKTSMLKAQAENLMESVKNFENLCAQVKFLKMYLLFQF